MAVLVLTAHDDDTATRVCQALASRGHDCVRMDLGDFPEKLSFTASGPGPNWAGRLSDGQRDLPLTDVDAVYWRRPTTFRLPDHLNRQQRQFAVAEARQGLGGLISCLPVPFGCFDFTVSADTEQWVFLECGANAQWGWLEHETGLPIADAIAGQLTADTK